MVTTEDTDASTTDDGTETDDEETSDSSGSDSDGGVPADLLAEQTLNILTDYCGTCHEAPNKSGGMDYIDDLQALIDNAKVVPGEPDNSPILIRMENGTMPPPGNEAPTPEEIALVRAWIEAGAPAPEPPETCDNSVVSYASLYDEVALDLLSVELEDREFTRYLSLHDLNNLGACDDTIERARSAAGKLVNSLSTAFETVAPVVTGPSGVLLRIDIRDYNWEEEGGSIDRWEQSLTFNQQSVRIDSDNAESARENTATDVPVQTLSSFLFFATQPPLYHDMLGIPALLDDLLINPDLGLNIDVDQAIADGDLTAAGVVDSGVSDQNRVVQRIPIAFARTFWLSFDFRTNSGNQNILSNPTDFEADGSEVIFSLPNGLHAYMIADAQGQRLDRAPVDVVQDPLQRTQEVINGISCMSCHAQGLLSVKDVVRDHVNTYPFAYEADELELVNELYTPREEFESDLNAATQTYHQSLQGAGATPGVTPDPLVQTFLNYDRDLDLDQVAAELGVPSSSLAVALPLLDPNLLILSGGGRIRRDTFNALFVPTMCTLNNPETTVLAEDCLEGN